MGKTINEVLGRRSSTYNGYQWGEIVSAMLDVYLSGGNCVEDVNKKTCHLRETPEVRIPTSHTVGRAIKELACENTEYSSSAGRTFKFNTNPKLNEFAGYKDCTICAVADKSGMICKVSVIFPAMDKWGDLDRCYSNYKSILSEKYGDPKDCVENFQHDYVNDDSSKKYELEMDRCKYYCIFDGVNGEIQLEITHQSLTCYVMLSYFDNANQEKLRKHIMDDL